MPKRTGPLGSIYFFLRPRRSLVRGVCWLISTLHLNYRLLEQAENKRNCSWTKMCILWNTPTSQMFNPRRLEKQFFFHHHNVAYIMQSSSCDLSFRTFPRRKYCPQSGRFCHAEGRVSFPRPKANARITGRRRWGNTQPRGHCFLLSGKQSLSRHAWFSAQGVLSCDEWVAVNLAVIMRVAGLLNPFELVIAAGLNNEH